MLSVPSWTSLFVLVLLRKRVTSSPPLPLSRGVPLPVSGRLGFIKPVFKTANQVGAWRESRMEYGCAGYVAGWSIFIRVKLLGTAYSRNSRWIQSYQVSHQNMPTSPNISCQYTPRAAIHHPPPPLYCPPRERFFYRPDEPAVRNRDRTLLDASLRCYSRFIKMEVNI